MKVYDAKTLVSGMEDRAKQYDQLRDQLNGLKTQFQAIVDNSGFQGKGAEAIKGFYQAQIEVVDVWLQLTEANAKFFRGVPGDTEAANFSGDTIVHTNTLENELSQSIRNAKTMVGQQQNE
ncbi:LXG domain-containing protein, partial [Metabacillus sp. GX 13764]|uniref:T7SS effector LXG polymorphic toxin n=1 Tax=Metabacillus kandeliae TaxID=2900151 RepID=UPI001E4797D0